MKKLCFGTQNNGNVPLFNLSGQRVNESYEGIVIKKGRIYLNHRR